ncbi:MAG: hypothetical protein MI920_26000 [Kiloniellales bacterium]|nr:hypothetical protein [Kiloniellales bacterium]
MPLLKAVLLICALDVAPADCRPETAIHVIAGPEAGALAACGLQSQALLAQSALAREVGERSYLKVMCRTEVGQVPTRPARELL